MRSDSISARPTLRCCASRPGAPAPTLAALLPELGERLGALPSGYPLPPDQARLRLYEAIGAVLAAIAAASTNARAYLGLPAFGAGAPADLMTFMADPLLCVHLSARLVLTEVPYLPRRAGAAPMSLP